jgi:hypothetical protein
MRGHIAFAFALLLSACASPNPIDPVATLQNVGYIDGANNLKIKAVIQSEEQSVPETIPGLSKGMRVYWFLGDR